MAWSGYCCKPGSPKPVWPGPQVVSVTTKKRMAVKSLQGLKLGKESIQVLVEHLKALQTASKQWQRTMAYASHRCVASLRPWVGPVHLASQAQQRGIAKADKNDAFPSHEELMEQLESTSRDLQISTERIRAVEAQRLAANRELEALTQQFRQADVERKTLLAALKQRWGQGRVVLPAVAISPVR